jgi:uncharacterized protein YajQ (UPF0234 family)
MRKEINKFKDFLKENSEEKLNISDVIDSKISKLIKRKLDGETLSEKEFLQLHNWMMENDKDYSNSVDKQLKKDLKKFVPKGTKIK